MRLWWIRLKNNNYLGSVSGTFGAGRFCLTAPRPSLCPFQSALPFLPPTHISPLLVLVTQVAILGALPHGPPVAVLTEWGPPSVRWQPPNGGSIYKIDAPDPAIPTTYCGKHIPTHACQINPIIYQLGKMLEKLLFERRP